MSLTPIHQLQGAGLFSKFAGQFVTTRGVVIGASRKGFFIQDSAEVGDPGSSRGLFVYERRRRPPIGSLVEVQGEVVDFQMNSDERPTTQLAERSTRVLEEQGPSLSRIG